MAFPFSSYLKYFLDYEIQNLNLRVIPVGGIELVKKFYKYLQLPISENIGDGEKGKIFCLTDTDTNMRKKDIVPIRDNKKSLVIMRLAENNTHSTTLINFEIEEKQNAMDIEKSLNPIIFSKTINELEIDEKFKIDVDQIQKHDGNTTNNNLRNFDIDSYFKTEEVKNKFALSYIKIMKEEAKPKDFFPSWIQKITDFYKEE